MLSPNRLRQVVILCGLSSFVTVCGARTHSLRRQLKIRSQLDKLHAISMVECCQKREIVVCRQAAGFVTRRPERSERRSTAVPLVDQKLLISFRFLALRPQSCVPELGPFTTIDATFRIRENP